MLGASIQIANFLSNKLLKCTQMSTPWPTNDADYVNRPGIRLVNSERYAATIKHPIKKVTVCLGIYDTKKEAVHAYNRKKLEYKSLSERDSTASSFLTNITDFEKYPGVKRIRKGKWRGMISQGKDKVYLGVYTTAKEAAEAYILSKLEQESQKPNRSRKVDASSSEITNPITEADEANEAYNNKRRESDLMVQSDGVAEGKSDSICVSDDPLVPTDDGSSVIKVHKVEETGDSMINIVNAETETTREFDLEIVDSNGELVGEYSKMDDELWFWRDEDAEDGHRW